jgi:predicted ATPase/DNA-binding CsgD family transcriptional regulator
MGVTLLKNGLVDGKSLPVSKFLGYYDGIGWNYFCKFEASQSMAFQKWQVPQEGLTRRALEILRLLAEGMSDREIAERLVMTINTVKWYNRQIYSILDVGSRTQAIARAHELHLLSEDTETAPAFQIVRRAPKHNLPVETTHFIGRKREIADIRRLLGTTRLLTLVGPPGTGKTRLSLRVGQEIIDSFGDGVYFVSLAPISDPALVANAIAAAIEVNEAEGQPLIETLKHVLRESQMLLILDNFEHLLPAARQVSELLAAAPHLKVLATSREPLHLYGEQEYAVPPLELPEPAHLEPQALADCESTALFVQQARAVRLDFELTPENASDVAQICVRLDGIPLAIELAAARSKLLSPSGLLARLSSRLDTLTGGAHDLPSRQQTLRNTIEWSYNLLDEGEKILFARLAVFRGGSSLEAIEAVCGGDLPLDVLDGLESLINKNLIQQKELSGGEARFVMLETLHEYAWERLEAGGEAPAIHTRCAEYFVELSERVEPELRLVRQRHWFQLIEAESENMRAILKWSLGEGDITLGVRLLSAALYLYWFAYGHHVEGRQWTNRLLERLAEVPAMYHSRLFICAGHMALTSDLEMARHYLSRALDVARERGETVNIAWSLTFVGYPMMVKDMQAAFAMTEAGLAMFREMNHKPGIAQALNIVGEIACFGGDDERAEQAYEECLRVSQEIGESRRVRFMLGNLTFLAQHKGDYEHAGVLAQQGLELSLEMNNRLDIANSLAVLAGVMGDLNQPERAARLFGAWKAALERMGAFGQPADKPEHDRCIAVVCAQLGEASFQSHWNEGRALSLDQAVEFALSAS